MRMAPGDRERAQEKAGNHRVIGRREQAETDEDEEEPENQHEEELRGNRGAGILPQQPALGVRC